MGYFKDQRVVAYLTPKNKEFLKAYTEKQELSKSSAVNDIIRQYANKLEKEKKGQK
jgi:hypothetical protein